MMLEPQVGFHNLSLSPELLAALDRAGYREPTPIQAAFIPEALAGRDVLGQAQTGTGKTAAFVLPFFNNWTDDNRPGPQGIVLAPTRELVVQVAEEAAKLAPSRHCRTVPIYGAQRYMIDPTNINLSPERVTVENIRQSYVTVDEDRKLELLLRVFDREEPRQCIIFCERKRWVEDLYRLLRRHRSRVAAMHGDLPQSMRNRIMQR